MSDLTKERLDQIRRVSHDGTSYAWSNHDMRQVVDALDRLEADAVAREAETGRLRGIVERLHKTADGVTRMPGDTVWFCTAGEVLSTKVGAYHYWGYGRGCSFNFHPLTRNLRVGETYSTMEAALAAAASSQNIQPAQEGGK
jgi:hypothetical protein